MFHPLTRISHLHNLYSVLPHLFHKNLPITFMHYGVLQTAVMKLSNPVTSALHECASMDINQLISNLHQCIRMENQAHHLLTCSYEYKNNTQMTFLHCWCNGVFFSRYSSRYVSGNCRKTSFTYQSLTCIFKAPVIAPTQHSIDTSTNSIYCTTAARGFFLIRLLQPSLRVKISLNCIPTSPKFGRVRIHSLSLYSSVSTGPISRSLHYQSPGAPLLKQMKTPPQKGLIYEA